jgi:hypothetical protein
LQAHSGKFILVVTQKKDYALARILDSSKQHPDNALGLKVFENVESKEIDSAKALLIEKATSLGADCSGLNWFDYRDAGEASELPRKPVSK